MTHSRVWQFSDGKKVFVKSQGRGETWLPGHIIESSEPVSFKVQLQDGRIISRHQDHLRNDSQRIQNSLIFLSLRTIWTLQSVLVERLALPVLHPQNRIERQLCRTHRQLLNRTVKLLHHYLSVLWLVIIPLEWESRRRDIQLSCTVPCLGGEECSDVTVLLLLFYI